MEKRQAPIRPFNRETAQESTALAAIPGMMADPSDINPATDLRMRGFASHDRLVAGMPAAKASAANPNNRK